MSNKKFLLKAILLLIFATAVWADGTTLVIKVNGRYGIINKGVNQGLQEGQVLFARRDTQAGMVEVGEVKVIRATANRAAVEHIKGRKGNLLHKGDNLFTKRELQTVLAGQSGGEDGQIIVKNVNRRQQQSRRIEPIIEPAEPETVFVAESNPSRRPAAVLRTAGKLRKPWLSFSAGAMIPNGNLALASTAGALVSGAYMVALGPGVNMGIEVSQSLIGSSEVTGADGNLFTTGSSSLMSATLVFQRFLGRSFFLEGGGGLFRPKLSLNSADNQKITYTSNHFGLIAGAGFFIPTSPYAGLIMKGRLHNYFNQTNKHYLGFTGGFRFKIR